MTNEQMEMIEYEIEHSLYFVEYPENVAENWWKDGDGKEQSMNRMGLDHLKACIRTVEKGIRHLKNSGRNQVIIDALMPLAQQKLSELKSVFDEKINY